MNLDFEYGIELIKKAFEKDTEDKLFEVWNLEHIFMDKEHFISFEKYKENLFKKQQSSNKNFKYDTKKILKEAEKIKALDQVTKRGGNV